jgi:metallo-beta-lactamase family protein
MTIRLRFHGASRMVTGSCYLLETEDARVLIDCGLFQGTKTERELNYRAFPFQPQKIHSLLLTHAHIDHTGLVPKLTKAGFQGTIHATEATEDLCSVMLLDSGHIQESEVKTLNERNRRRGLPEVEPIYTMNDAETALTQFRPVAFETWVNVAKGIRARWWNAGHLLGSASIEAEVDQAGKPAMRILFSGDVGPDTKLLQHDPEAPAGFDHVICESTYGGRDRFERAPGQRREILAKEIQDAAARKGALLIPSFAVERTQEVVTDIIALMELGKIPKANVFIDSPLAQKATAIFARHSKTLENGDELYRAFRSPQVRYTESAEDSKAIGRLSGFHIIIAASGMCDAGRIRHHLKNHLWRANATVLLVGFQAKGSLGAILEEGIEKIVKIHGEDIQVRATVRRFEDYSGHADGPELVQWVKERLPIARNIFLTHGEEEAQLAFEAELANDVVAAGKIVRPRLDDVYDLDGASARLVESETRPRIDPLSVAKPDWHNDLTKLVLDLNEEVKKAADEKSRGVILRRLRRALAGDGARGGEANE